MRDITTNQSFEYNNIDIKFIETFELKSLVLIIFKTLKNLYQLILKNLNKFLYLVLIILIEKKKF